MFISSEKDCQSHQHPIPSMLPQHIEEKKAYSWRHLQKRAFIFFSTNRQQPQLLRETITVYCVSALSLFPGLVKKYSSIAIHFDNLEA
jgi:hypothetical protein